MKPSEIRRELLQQHAALRALLEEASQTTGRWGRGERAREEACACLARLADALRSHNRREEELLGGVIRGIDAWGPSRAEIMNEEHVTEHREIHLALLDIVAASEAGDTERRIDRLRARVLEHMAREEEAFLREDVLRDDAVSVDSFGG